MCHLQVIVWQCVRICCLARCPPASIDIAISAQHVLQGLNIMRREGRAFSTYLWRFTVNSCNCNEYLLCCVRRFNFAAIDISQSMMFKSASTDNSVVSDKLLSENIKAGDKESYKLLFVRYYCRVRNFIFRFIHDMDKSEDIAQDIFVNLWLNRHKLDPDKSIKNFLYISARNAALNILKKECGATSFNIPIDATYQQSTNDNIEYHELKLIIKSAVESMPEQRRKIFIMSRIYQLPAKDIAELTHLSVRTVEKHLELARLDIKKAIADI